VISNSIISGRRFNIAISSLVCHEQWESDSITNREREGNHGSDNRRAVKRSDAEMVLKFGIEAIDVTIDASACAKDLPHGSNLPTPSVISK